MLDTMLNENVGPSLVINEGKAGETLSEGAQRLGSVLSIHTGVEYIYILQGANDVSDDTNTPVGQMLVFLEQMVDQANTHSLHPILLTVPPRTREALSYDQTWPTTEDWNNALRDYAIVNGIDLVDLHQAFVIQPGWESFLEEFGLHLTVEGQEFVAEVMYSAVAPLLE
jgi:lysophospholipase L1-like esterase